MRTTLDAIRPIELAEIREARTRIASTIVRTPLVHLEMGPNYPDIRGSAALGFARGLATQHEVTVLDPVVEAAGFPEDLPLIREVPHGRRFDAVVIALKHRDTDVAALRELSPILIDLVRGATEATESISSTTR